MRRKGIVKMNEKLSMRWGWGGRSVVEYCVFLKISRVKVNPAVVHLLKEKVRHRWEVVFFFCGVTSPHVGHILRLCATAWVWVPPHLKCLCQTHWADVAHPLFHINQEADVRRVVKSLWEEISCGKKKKKMKT